jgi:hypothetical protein
LGMGFGESRAVHLAQVQVQVQVHRGVRLLLVQYILT